MVDVRAGGIARIELFQEDQHTDLVYMPIDKEIAFFILFVR